MTGVWAQAVVAAVAGQARPEGAVQDLTVEPGRVSGRVAGCEAALTAALVPPRIWTAMSRYARNKGALESAVAGLIQSAHLAQLMHEDWGEPLVPDPGAIGHSCTCDGARGCEHVAALASAFAAEIDRDPGALLRWRGCVESAVTEIPGEDELPRLILEGDPWRGGALPEPRPAQPLLVGSMLKRLGPSGIRVGDEDLADVLERAYRAFAAR